MDQDASPVNWLISHLAMKHAGRPAIIVGGGPSAPGDLARIMTRGKAVIISANAHAFKLELKVDYIWCKDHIRVVPGYLRRGHKKEFMEPELRKFGVPILSPQFWADYRALEWPLNNANSGMQAIGAAALMGCRPIIPVGLDCFQGATYFHDPNQANVSNNRPPAYWGNRFNKLRAALEGAVIRGMSGQVARTWGQYRIDETYPGDVIIPPVLRRYVNRPTVWLRIRRDVQDSRDKTATIPAGYNLAADEAEAARLTRAGVADRIQMFHA